MNNKETMQVKVNDAIALCHILDELESFNQNLVDFLTPQRDSTAAIIYKLSILSKGEKILGSTRIKQFYNENKDVIDTISTHSNFIEFILKNYSFGPNIQYISYYIYEYILKNKDKLDNVLAVLTRIKELGFNSFEFNTNLDFTENSYFVSKFLSDNLGALTYLDNLEAVPSYDGTIVEYKSNSSNYMMELSIIPRKILSFESKIFLNDLTFDANRLPKTLSLEETFNRICSLANTKQEEYNIVRNSVDMSIGIDDLLQIHSKISSEFSRLDGVESKPELLAELTKIKEAIDTMKSLSEQYNQQMIANNQEITESLLNKEKQAYTRRREQSKLHID